MIEGIIGKKMQLWKWDEAKCAGKNDSDIARKDSNDIAHYWILSKREMDENNNGLLKKKKTVYSLNAGAVMTHIQWLCNEPEMQPKVTLT